MICCSLHEPPLPPAVITLYWPNGNGGIYLSLCQKHYDEHMAWTPEDTLKEWDQRIARWQKARASKPPREPLPWPETKRCPVCGRGPRAEEHRYDAMDREPGDIPKTEG